MLKRNICFLLTLLLCLTFLGCDEDETATSETSVSFKGGYVYAPLDPELNKDGLMVGLIALEQSVTPTDYEPVEGAYVSIGNSRVKTDKNGNFKISGIKPGEHRMLVSAKGYLPVVQLTAVSGSSTATIAIDTMKIIPDTPVMTQDDMLQFTAVGKEMGGNFVPLSAIIWSVLSEDEDKEDDVSITNQGILTASTDGTFTVIAASGNYNATTEVTVLEPANASTSTLTGEVTLPSGSPVSDAVVIVSGTHLSGMTDEDGDYSILNVPSDNELNVFVVKNHTLIGSAPLTMEKWKQKSLDILADLEPSSVSDDEETAVEDPNDIDSTTGSILGYVYIPAVLDEGETNEEMLGLTVVQSEKIPEGYMAISGAKVMWESDPTIYSITSTDGGFILENIPYNAEGPYYVSVSLEGYVTVRAPVLFTGKYPAGIVTKIDIYPENPVVYLDGAVEFLPLFYDRNGELLESSRVDWSVEGDVGEITQEGFFTPSRVGNGTALVTYGDITERKNFTIVSKEEGGKLSGLVTDEEEKPVEGAFVILEDYPWMAMTDENGEYNISFVPTGEKIPLIVKVYGQKCGSAIAGVARGDSAVEDISIIMPREPLIAEEPETDDNIADNPPVSISPENPSNNTNIGEVPDNVVSEADTETGEEVREEFPRWPDNNETGETEESSSTNDQPREEFPRWPDATPSNN